jgi:hypothetical protein
MAKGLAAVAFCARTCDMSFPTLFTSLLLLALASLSASGQSRTWTDVTGRKIEAVWVATDSEKITVEMNGRRFDIPLVRLSAEDVAWAKAQSNLTPTATALPMQLAGVDVKADQRIEFEIPVPEAMRERGDKLTTGFEEYADADMTKALVGLYLPPGFDPAKSWPVIIVSVTNSGRDKGRDPSSVKTMSGYVDAARELGWVVLAADCTGYKTPGSPFNRSALVEAALDSMATVWPTSKTWPLATGGFSGGAKYSGWIAGWLAERGRSVVGIFMAGCNEDSASSALDKLKPQKKQFVSAKVFLSTGKTDEIAGPTDSAKVVDSLQRTGFEVKEALHEEGHTLDRAHVKEALEWFHQPSAAP